MEKQLQPIDKGVWETRKENEKENSTHPCDYWDIEECMCKGACSCHWDEDMVDPQGTVQTLRSLQIQFYYMCISRGLSHTAHSFLEFNGLIGKYIDLVERAVAAGISPTSINEHSKVALPVEEHDMQYLGEKLRCIFGPVIDSNPAAKLVLHKTLFK